MFRTMFPDDEPPRFYRRIGEIREDIREINEKIEQTRSMFNVRQMLIDLLFEKEEEDDGESWIDAIEALLDGARRALERLEELREQLETLEYELEDTECAMRA